MVSQAHAVLLYLITAPHSHDTIQLVLSDSDVQRRVSVYVHSMQVGSVLQQQLSDVNTACKCCPMQTDILLLKVIASQITSTGQYGILYWSLLSAFTFEEKKKSQTRSCCYENMKCNIKGGEFFLQLSVGYMMKHNCAEKPWIDLLFLSDLIPFTEKLQIPQNQQNRGALLQIWGWN